MLAFKLFVCRMIRCNCGHLNALHATTKAVYLQCNH